METVDPGEGFTEDGNLVTRDLLYDKATNKQFIMVLAVAVIVGVAGWYFKIYRPKKQQAADAAEDYGDDYDDTPPWEDEDETESEGEE